MIFDGFFENNMKNGFGITYKNNNELKYSGKWVNNQFELLNEIPHSHHFSRNDFNDRIYCDYCDSDDSGVSCRECNIDICDKCIIEINKKLLRINKNLSIEKYSNFIKCNLCELRKKGIFFKKNNIIILFSLKYCYECFKNM